MKHKRLITASLMSIALLTACGGGGGESPKEPAGEPAPAEAAVTAAPEESSKESPAELPESSGAAPAEALDLSSKVLVDEAGIRITAGEFVQDDFLDDGIRILIENENPMTCLIDCQLLVVNGYQVGGSFSAQVAAGKKLNTVLEIPRHALRTAEIEEIHSVSAAFAVYDPEPWRTVLKPEEKVIFDDGTKAAEPSDPGTEVFFKEGVHVSARMVRNDPFLGTGIILYLKNEGERTVYAEAKNLSIDGYMLEGYSGTILWPGKRAIGKIYLSDGDLAENGITDPKEAELYVGLMSAETMEDIVSGTGTFRIG